MTKLLVPLLAVIVVVAVGFVLVELRAPLTPSSPSTPSTSPPALPVAAPPPARPLPVAAPPPSAQLPPPNSQPEPVAPPADPLDVVVRGKTRREWHAYYAERQQQMTADIQRYQAIVDRAIAGEEPDPRDLTNAHDSIRELKQRMKEDLEALQQIDATP